MKNKILISILGLLIIYCLRIIELNKQVENVKVETYDIGDEVEMGEDIAIYGSMNGYSLRIDSAKVMSYEQFCIKYGGEANETDPPEKIYDICITLKNTDGIEGTGVNFCDFYIQSSDTLASIYKPLYEIANPELKSNYAIALRNNTEMQFHLPYYLVKDYFTKKNWENIENFRLNFVVTLYPTKKVISLVK